MSAIKVWAVCHFPFASNSLLRPAMRVRLLQSLATFYSRQKSAGHKEWTKYPENQSLPTKTSLTMEVSDRNLKKNRSHDQYDRTY